MGKKPSVKKRYMSVREMGDLLGIKKSDRYWLLKKGYFNVIEAAGKMWVETASFEAWYAGQTRYHKVTGEEPGRQLAMQSLSVKEMAALLGVSKGTAYDIILRDHIPTFMNDYMIRVIKKDFWIWYDCQIRYRIAEEDLPDRGGRKNLLSIQEMADILAVPTTEAYRIAEDPRYTSILQITMIEERMYITFQGFDRFLRSQEEYSYVPAKDPGVLRASGRICLNTRQAGWYAKVCKGTVIYWYKEGKFPVRKAGNHIRIPLNEFDEWLKKRKEAGS